MEDVAILNGVISKPGVDIAILLSESRKDFMTAWGNFFSQVQNLVSLHIAIYTVVVATVYFFLKEATEHPYLLVCGGLLMLVAYLVGLKAKVVVSSTFDLYVAAVIYSCQLHVAAKACTHHCCTHHWFELVRDNLGLRHPTTKKLPKTKRQLMDIWSRDFGSTHYAYSSLIDAMKWVSLLGGAILVVVGARLFAQQW